VSTALGNTARRSSASPKRSLMSSRTICDGQSTTRSQRLAKSLRSIDSE